MDGYTHITTQRLSAWPDEKDGQKKKKTKEKLGIGKQVWAGRSMYGRNDVTRSIVGQKSMDGIHSHIHPICIVRFDLARP